MHPETGGLGLGVTPIGPTWDPEHYFLGADNQGRDVAARLLYGGRNSLLIGFFAALITCVLGTLDRARGRLLRRLRRRRALARPGHRLGVSRLPARDLPLDGADHATGVAFGPFRLGSGSLAPADRDHRHRLRAVRRPPDPRRGALAARREFVEAAIGLGASNRRLLVKDILPNVVTTVIVFFPLVMAIAMLTEAALSFLSIGVQPPDASWGTIIQDGDGLIYTRPAVALAPGIAIAVTVLALNVLGDGIRDALDPRAKLRGFR